MEDPWSTPWAVETPSASPGLPPTKPKTVARLPGTGTITPTEGGVLDIGGAAFENSPWGGATTTINGGFDATQQDEDKDEDARGRVDQPVQQRMPLTRRPSSRTSSRSAVRRAMSCRLS